MGKQHWEKIYQTKQPDEVSWTQQEPKTSLAFIHSFGLPKSARIIDVGGGDSRLVDFLLQKGYQNVTVLDISGIALARAKQRLGNKANRVKWIESDITKFVPAESYDVWHDRATFHFLTSREQIHSYLETARKAIEGYLVIGTFSDKGPNKCSGLEVKQYSEEELQLQLAAKFQKIRCITEDHVTPFHTTQNFLFCSFRTTITQQHVKKILRNR
ncbi:class I SAM-dependent methyltransferase [Pontibacter sp. 172403-2]|uniref:class I SAM-dependent methyltransferase n=1 Tax=Pontibacter rufus TaxID=2791028 RepID=UPI0018AF6BFC|nr:class I SAM-dependent methyltransferase [Pontibacter sp. 172403-2]MBF9252175.1 class I SAM-dependent methyltransferase [Pontibacter sp. 172403-2]